MLADVLTPDAARALPGPDWLRALRAAAADRAAVGDLPDTAAEEWRYSRVGELELERFVAAPSPADGGADDLPDLGPAAGRLVHRDGHLVLAELAPEVADRGVRFGRLADLDAAPAGTIEQSDVFGELNLAHAPDPLVLVVPRNVTIAEPFQVLGTVGADGALALPRLVVEAGENCEFTLVVWLGGDADAVVVPRTEVTVGQAARVTLVSVNELGPSVDQLGETSIAVGQEATATVSHLALGGDYSRSRFDCRLVGRGAAGRVTALYLGDGEQMHDLRTFQTHEAPDTTSELLFKGALDDRARAVYTGLIRVDHEGRGSNAQQTNRVVKLSEDAWAESVPNLEINHNDVRCSHATAVGPIDEDQRFYLESRGVPPEAAERLVVNGFFEEVLAAVPVPHVARRARALISARLGAVA